VGDLGDGEGVGDGGEWGAGLKLSDCRLAVFASQSSTRSCSQGGGTHSA
jgi:hypothetical protein